MALQIGLATGLSPSILMMLQQASYCWVKFSSLGLASNTLFSSIFHPTNILKLTKAVSFTRHSENVQQKKEKKKKENELKVRHRPLCWISCLLWTTCLTTLRHYFQAVMEIDIDLYLLMILVYVRASHFCVQFLLFFFHVLLFLLLQTLVPGEKKH